LDVHIELSCSNADDIFAPHHRKLDEGKRIRHPPDKCLCFRRTCRSICQGSS
uniref:Ovule protein n=1 Tax=Haemonchus placei TaxID=6290 RepID=A0A0N4WFE9_HAEPC